MLGLGHVGRFLWHIFREDPGSVHSTDCGYSILAYVTGWPIFLTEVVIMPAAFVVLGWFIDQTLSVALGWWLMASGLSLAMLAVWEATRRYEARRVATDGMIQANTSLEAISEKKRKSRGDNVIDIADFG